ncbi:MAG: GntR family transcriptional regulator [Tannerellaceae bacterium]|jgi:DNA-binding transcriptional regulator YhcF (GntR family)|nr:GntR family transcriptional regulator [Tannerellaceae bacterium]
MNYNANLPIFIQIADRIADRVLSNEYLPDARIPSVRELGVEMEVNPNTVMRSFDWLQSHGIIYNKRGIGYFIAAGAREKVREMRHQAFIGEVLPSLFKEMTLLDIGMDELSEAYKHYLSANKSERRNEVTYCL